MVGGVIRLYTEPKEWFYVRASRAKKSLLLISPYWNITLKELKELLSRNNTRRDFFRILFRFPERHQDLQSIDPNALKDIASWGGKGSVRVLDKLHTKIYVKDDKEILIGSSNMTRSGLGLNEGNYEICVSLRGRIKEIIKEAEDLWERGILVKDEWWTKWKKSTPKPGESSSSREGMPRWPVEMSRNVPMSVKEKGHKEEIVWLWNCWDRDMKREERWKQVRKEGFIVQGWSKLKGLPQILDDYKKFKRAYSKSPYEPEGIERAYRILRQIWHIRGYVIAWSGFPPNKKGEVQLFGHGTLTDTILTRGQLPLSLQKYSSCGRRVEWARSPIVTRPPEYIKRAIGKGSGMLAFMKVEGDPKKIVERLWNVKGRQ